MKKLLVCLLMIPAIARAEFWTGNDLYSRFSSNEFMERAQGLGYVMGVYDAQVHIVFCPPNEKNINAGQLRDMVFQYLNVYPGQRHRPAYALIAETFKAVWPCANRTPGRGA